MVFSKIEKVSFGFRMGWAGPYRPADKTV